MGFALIHAAQFPEEPTMLDETDMLSEQEQLEAMTNMCWELAQVATADRKPRFGFRPKDIQEE